MKLRLPMRPGSFGNDRFGGLDKSPPGSEHSQAPFEHPEALFENPEGMFENSPTFQGWESVQNRLQVPKGRLTDTSISPKCVSSVVPSGLMSSLTGSPNLKRLDYCQAIPPGWKSGNRNGIGWKQRPRFAHRAEAAFTLVEVMIASSIGLLIMAAVMIFLQFGGTYISGITAQSAINQQAGNTLEFLQMRVRLATTVSNDASGNALTLSFDDNPAQDSDSDGVSYNDKDHWERFQFIGMNGNTNTVSTNRLVYIPNLAAPANQQVLIPAGVHNLPGCNIFSVTNQSTVIIRFGIGDGYVADHFQGVDIQSTAVPLNRPVATNFVGIVP